MLQEKLADTAAKLVCQTIRSHVAEGAYCLPAMTQAVTRAIDVACSFAPCSGAKSAAELVSWLVIRKLRTRSFLRRNCSTGKMVSIIADIPGM
eukprot:4965066-Pleurochrysis_carterae.AAC.1